MTRGMVALVGAGPGDPELLTRAAVRRLRRADAVLFDALVMPEVLRFAPRTARRVFVGKRAGRPALTQAAINAKLIRLARQGARVVRLKGGDPFVFGRGGEEALALAAAGVPFEIVPGVSSATAAPASVGVPVTHRGLVHGVAVLDGHAESSLAPAIDSLAPGALTLVVLMGLANREALARRLLARGWPPAMPAAIVLGAWTPAETAWFGTLAELGTVRFTPQAGPPGTLVIGEVVGLAALLGHPSLGATPCAAADDVHPEISTC